MEAVKQGSVCVGVASGTHVVLAALKRSPSELAFVVAARAHPDPAHVSNVMLVCPACGQPTRVGFRLLEGGGKTRTCRRANCGKDIDKA